MLRVLTVIGPILHAGRRRESLSHFKRAHCAVAAVEWMARSGCAR
jgi:hypothetical protein